MREPRVLTEDEMELAFEYAIQRKSLSETAKRLGFANDMAFVRYREKNPQFEKALQSARNAACEYIEDDMLNIATLDIDPKMARVMLEALARVAAFRNPARYGNKVELNVNQTVDLSAALRAAEARLLPQAPDIEIKPNDFNALK